MLAKLFQSGFLIIKKRGLLSDRLSVGVREIINALERHFVQSNALPQRRDPGSRGRQRGRDEGVRSSQEI